MRALLPTHAPLAEAMAHSRITTEEEVISTVMIVALPSLLPSDSENAFMLSAAVQPRSGSPEIG